MCDYMYYEQRQRFKRRNFIPAEKELELDEIVATTEKKQQPMTVRA